MSCSCGSHTFKAGGARHRVGTTVYDLAFGECPGCGRVGGEFLAKDGETVAIGISARLAFLRLKAGEELALPPVKPVVSNVKPTPISEPQTPIAKENTEHPLDRLARSSEYHPYKMFQIGEGPAIKVLLIKASTGPSIAACPSLGICIESEDYLKATLAVGPEILNALSLPADTRITTTCTQRFTVDQAEEVSKGTSETVDVLAQRETIVPEPQLSFGFYLNNACESGS